MTAVTYHGEYPLEQVDGEGKPYIEQEGYIFHQGKSVDVKGDDKLERLARNRFFKVAGKSDKEEVAKGEDEGHKAEVEALQAWLTDHQVPFHHKAGLAKLQGLKADYQKAEADAAKANEG